MARPRKPRDLAGRVKNRRRAIQARLAAKEAAASLIVSTPVDDDETLVLVSHQQPVKMTAEEKRKQKIADKAAETAEKGEEVSGGFEHISKAAEYLAHTELGWLTAFTSIISLPLHIYKIIHAAAISKADGASRGKQIAMSVLGIGVGVLAFAGVFVAKILAAPFIVIASTGKNLLESIWDFGLSIKKYYSDKRTIREKQQAIEARFYELAKNPTNLSALKDARAGNPYATLTDEQSEIIKLDRKLTNYDNKLISLRENIATAGHRIFKALLGLAGGILLLLIPPVGAKLLLTSALYNIADAAGANPFKWIGRGINAISKKVFNINLDPFARKNHHDSMENIELKVNEIKAREISVIATPKVVEAPEVIDAPKVIATPKEVKTSEVEVLETLERSESSSTKICSSCMQKSSTMTPISQGSAISQDSVFADPEEKQSLLKALQLAKQRAREKQAVGATNTAKIFGDARKPLLHKTTSGRFTPSSFKKTKR